LQVESADIICSDCGKKCKSKGGYKRHRNSKHKDTNTPEIDNTTQDPIQTTCSLIPSTLTQIVEDVIQHILEKDVFTESIYAELRLYRCKELKECSKEFLLLKGRNRNADKLYMNFYGKVCLYATTFFPGLSRNSVTLLAAKVADSMLTYCDKSKTTTNIEVNTNFIMSEQEIAGLQYLGGYVLHNLVFSTSGVSTLTGD